MKSLSAARLSASLACVATSATALHPLSGSHLNNSSIASFSLWVNTTIVVPLSERAELHSCPTSLMITSRSRWATAQPSTRYCTQQQKAESQGGGLNHCTAALQGSISTDSWLEAGEWPRQDVAGILLFMFYRCSQAGSLSATEPLEMPVACNSA